MSDLITLSEFWASHSHTSCELVDNTSHIIGELYNDSIDKCYPHNERVLNELGCAPIKWIEYDEDSMIIYLDYFVKEVN